MGVGTHSLTHCPHAMSIRFFLTLTLAYGALAGPKVLLITPDRLDASSRGIAGLQDWLAAQDLQVAVLPAAHSQRAGEFDLVLDCVGVADAAHSSGTRVVLGAHALAALPPRQSGVTVQTISRYRIWNLMTGAMPALAQIPQTPVQNVPLAHVTLDAGAQAFAWAQVEARVEFDWPASSPMPVVAESVPHIPVLWQTADGTYVCLFGPENLAEPAAALLLQHLLASLLGQPVPETAPAPTACAPDFVRFFARTARTYLSNDETRDELARFSAYATGPQIDRLHATLAKQALTISAGPDWLLGAGNALATAGEIRRMGRASSATIAALLRHPLADVRILACRLAGIGRVEAATRALEALLLDREQPFSVRLAAAEALQRGAFETRLETTLPALPGNDDRILAAVLLARRDPTAACQAFAETATKVRGKDAVSLADAFALLLSVRSFRDAITKTSLAPSGDARKALRFVLKREGIAAEDLNKSLRSIAGYKPTHQQILRRNKDRVRDAVMRQGKPKLGRDLFFSERAACATCHTVGGRGNDIGPELTQLGLQRDTQTILDALIRRGAGETAVALSLPYGDIYHASAADRDRYTRTNGEPLYLPQHSQVEKQPVSLMAPDGIDELSQVDVYHLAAFLTQLGSPGKSSYLPEPVVTNWLAYPYSGALPTRSERSATRLYAGADNQVLVSKLKDLGTDAIVLSTDLYCRRAGSATVSISRDCGLVSCWLRDEHGWEEVVGDTIQLATGTSQLAVVVNPAIAGQPLRVELSGQAIVELRTPHNRP
ncbi:MAG TPA: hypothetical protein DCR55_07665 [Lentisphaeria bacterium]|nr:hypothetical protein [Lentisphaeria bacterium]